MLATGGEEAEGLASQGMPREVVAEEKREQVTDIGLTEADYDEMVLSDQINTMITAATSTELLDLMAELSEKTHTGKKKLAIFSYLCRFGQHDLYLRLLQKCREQIPFERTVAFTTEQRRLKAIMFELDHRGRNLLHHIAHTGKKQLLGQDYLPAIMRQDDPVLTTTWLVKNKKGRTPLHIACKHGHLTLTTQILQLPPNPARLLVERDESGLTPLGLLHQRLAPGAPWSAATHQLWRAFVELQNHYLDPDSSRMLYGSLPTENVVAQDGQQIPSFFAVAEYLTRYLQYNENLFLGARLFLNAQPYLVTKWCDDKRYPWFVLELDQSGADAEQVIEVKIVLRSPCRDNQFPYLVQGYQNDHQLLAALMDFILKPYLESERFRGQTVGIELYGFGLAGLVAQQMSIYLLRDYVDRYTSLALVTVHAPRLATEYWPDIDWQQLLARETFHSYHQYVEDDQYPYWGQQFVSSLNQKRRFFLKLNVRASEQERLLPSENYFSRHQQASYLRQLHFARPFLSSDDYTFQLSMVVPTLPEQRDRRRSLGFIKQEQDKHGELDEDVSKISGPNLSEIITEFHAFDGQDPDDRLLNQFAHGEYLFRYLAYRHLADGVRIPVLEPSPVGADGFYPQRDYDVYRLVHTSGLYVYLLKPCQQQSAAEASAAAEQRVTPTGSSVESWKVIFQGTDFSEFDSAMRDLERGSAGFKSLMHARICLLMQLNANIKASAASNIELIIGGHSLGGADGQNFFTLTLLALLQNKLKDTSLSAEQLPKQSKQLKQLKKALANQLPEQCISELHRVTQISLMVYNSAGIRKSTQSLSEALAYCLKQLRPKLCVATHFQQIANDPVQKVGQGVACAHAYEAAPMCILHFEEPEIHNAHLNFQFRGRTSQRDKRSRAEGSVWKEKNIHTLFQSIAHVGGRGTSKQEVVRRELITRFEPEELSAPKQTLANLLLGPRI